MRDQVLHDLVDAALESGPGRSRRTPSGCTARSPGPTSGSVGYGRARRRGRATGATPRRVDGVRPWRWASSRRPGRPAGASPSCWRRAAGPGWDGRVGAPRRPRRSACGGPSYRTGSGPHTARQTSMISSRTRPRSAKGPTPAAAYSSVDQPVPRPATTRPSLAASNVARDLASWNGPCSGATRKLVPSSARSVPATTGASVTTASGTPRYWPGHGDFLHPAEALRRGGREQGAFVDPETLCTLLCVGSHRAVHRPT
ncbi:hypothetical protein QFZ22_008178 [Streptomyces canus]|uniref:Uncharacterized protein n=1 Tax=Streptomyces canus TaxID=58343 RepID=A0AAW8FQH6_9ACTN|nr:hypothetical protein [Streptomyces canus]